MAQREFRQIYPQPGWVEHDPTRSGTQLGHGAPGAGRGRAAPRRDIAAIGITNQRETTVVWNRRTGQPVHNAIVWQDRRAEPLCAAAARAGPGETHPPQDRAGAGRLLLGTKLRWLLDHVPARAPRRKGELAFGTVDSWLLWQLTGGRCTPPT
jgi:glycerol kinase